MNTKSKHLPMYICMQGPPSGLQVLKVNDSVRCGVAHLSKDNAGVLTLAQ